MNFKKLLSFISILSVMVPLSLTVSACDINPNAKIDKEIIDSITKEKLTIKVIDQQTLKLMAEGEKNIIELLTDSSNGLSNAIKTNPQTPKSFNQKLFSLDTKNIYYDDKKKMQVTSNDLIKDNTTDKLYFEFTYDKIHEEKLVEVDLTLSMSDSKIAKQIKEKLEQGVDGSALTEANTQGDALNLMQNTQGIKDIAKLSFVNSDDASLPLNKNSNKLNIIIKVGSKQIRTNRALVKNVQNLSYKDIQNELIKNINTHPLTLTAFPFKDGEKGEQAARQQLLDDTDKYFKDNLTGIYHDEFNSKYLGIFKYTYETPGGSFTDSSIFTKEGSYIIYFYIGYNKTAQTEDNGGYIKVNLTVRKPNYSEIQAELIKNINTHPLTLTAFPFKDGEKGEQAARQQLLDNTDKYFKDNLTGIYHDEFNSKYLGIFKYTYETPGGSFTDSSIFTKEGSYIIYFYIGYNKTAQTEDNGGYIKVNLNVRKPNYSEIQAELIKNITAKPLELTVSTFKNAPDGEKAVQTELKNNTNKYFKDNLTGIYQNEFNSKYLGLYNHVYKNNKIGPENYVDADFFSKAQTVTVYFYIGYNETAQTVSGGDLIPITLTVSLNDNDQQVVDEINNSTWYSITTIDGDDCSYVESQITSSFIKSGMISSKELFNENKFEFADVTVNGKSLQTSDLTKIGDIKAQIQYFYAGAKETTNLTISVLQKYNYSEIQTQLIKNITAKPLELTVSTFKNAPDGEKAVQTELKNNTNKYFKDNLTGIYQNEFNSKYLGLYNHVYKNNKIGPENYVDADFFSKAQTVTVYFYIGYNETAQTVSGGDLIPITLTVK